jgi:hypothetical protein
MLQQTERELSDFYQDDGAVKKMARFIVRYSYHAAPKGKLFRQIKVNQAEAYYQDAEREGDNDFKGVADELTDTDIAWTAWHYVNSYGDWTRKLRADIMVCDNGVEMPPLIAPERGKKYKSVTKWTSDGKRRGQPKSGSEGMIVYEKFLKFVREMRLHPEFIRIRREANRLCKLLEIIPTFVDGEGPEEDGTGGEGKSDSEDDDEMEAPVIDAFFEA